MRIGTVPYYNCLPLVAHLDSPPAALAPSGLAGALLSDELDVALMPTASIIKNGFHAYPECGLIGCDGAVKSVGFFVKNTLADLAKIKTLYRDQDSATSVRLGEIILRTTYSREPDTITAISYAERMNADAQLLIGDKALFFTAPNYRYFDLGTLWQELTNTGFMFACWAAKKPLTETEQGILTQAKIRGLATRAGLVEQIANPNRAVILEYLTHNIVYENTERVQAGFEKFRNFIS